MNDSNDKLCQSPFLWLDPLKDEYIGPVLLAEDISKYIYNFGVLIKKETFEPGNLKGASYSMRPHPRDGWYFDRDGNQNRLPTQEDEHGKYYKIEPNSLVYIKLFERLIVPYYIIGRHNLTIKYVYQGLLLGTGPQVDPGYEGNLYIPLHNLTDAEVRVYIEKSFVSIDFVRTSPVFTKGSEIPKDRKEFREKYPDKKAQNEGKLGREKLCDYIDGKKPSSSLASFVPKIDEFENRINKIREDRKRFDYGVLIAALALFVAISIGFYTIFVNLDMRIDANIGTRIRLNNRICELTNYIRELQHQMDFLSKSIDQKQAELALLNAELKQTQTQLTKINKHLGISNNQVHSIYPNK